MTSITERMADIYLQKLADATTPETLDDLEARLYRLVTAEVEAERRLCEAITLDEAMHILRESITGEPDRGSGPNPPKPGSLAPMLVDHGEATVCPPEAAASPTLAEAFTELAEAAGAELQTEAAPQSTVFNPVKGAICVLNGQWLEFDGIVWRPEAPTAGELEATEPAPLPTALEIRSQQTIHDTSGLPGDHLVMNGVEYVRTFETPTGWRAVGEVPPAAIAFLRAVDPQ